MCISENKRLAKLSILNSKQTIGSRKAKSSLRRRRMWLQFLVSKIYAFRAQNFANLLYSISSVFMFRARSFFHSRPTSFVRNGGAE